jgi:hypothetical protein
MTNDTNERHKTREWGRFPHKGKGKRMASKFKRQLAKKDVDSRRQEG